MNHKMHNKKKPHAHMTPEHYEDVLHEKAEKVHKKVNRMEKKESSLHNKMKSVHEHMEKESPKKRKVEKVMHEWAEGKLHSGSKKGPKVKSQKQAVAIALSEARHMKKKKGKK